MKNIILAAACLVTLTAHADDTERCVQLGGVFVTAANLRDTSGTPQEALQYTEQFPAVSLADRKRAVNLVYFDPAFQRVSYPVLQQQVFMICMGAIKPHQPLK